MSGSGYRKGSSWNSNQRLMLVMCCIMGILWLIGIIMAWKNGANSADIIAGSVCFGMFALIPVLILIVSRLRSRGRKIRTDIIRTQGPAPQGHVNIEISADERFPKICVCCGEKTGRVSKFHYRSANTEANRYDWSRVNPFVMIFLLWQFTFQMMVAKIVMVFERFQSRRKSRSGDLIFRIPHCGHCQRNSPILQRAYDFHARKMTIATVADFATTLKKLRKSSR